MGDNAKDDGLVVEGRRMTGFGPDVPEGAVFLIVSFRIDVLAFALDVVAWLVGLAPVAQTEQHSEQGDEARIRIHIKHDEGQDEGQEVANHIGRNPDDALRSSRRVKE